MPKYLIEREISGAGKLSPEELHGISRKSCDVLEGLGPQIQWVQSYATDDRICCIYIAPDADLIREHAGQGGFPVNRISEIRAGIDPTTAEPRWTRSVGATRDTGAGPAGPAPFHEAPWPPASDVPRAGGLRTAPWSTAPPVPVFCCFSSSPGVRRRPMTPAPPRVSSKSPPCHATPDLSTGVRAPGTRRQSTACSRRSMT